MADHSKPLVTSTYANFVTELDGRFDDIAKGLDPATTTPTNLPTGSIRWNSASSKWEKWSGTAWADLAASYNINLSGPLTLTANSSSDALRITQTGAGNALVVEDSANPDSSPFVIDTNGNAIVGLASSTTINSVSPAFEANANGASSISNAVINWSSAGSGAGGATQAFARSISGTRGSQGAVVSGTVLSNVSSYGSDGSAFVEAARISAIVDGTPGTNNMPGRLIFSTTADGASSPTERMRIDSAGRVGFSVTPNTATGMMRFGMPFTGATTINHVLDDAVIQSDVTATARYFRTTASTAASSFTLTALNHYVATQGTIGAGSSVTSQYGFLAESSLTGATNNYGFYSNIASGTGRWNFYAAGTAANYFAGDVGIGSSANYGKLSVQKDIAFNPTDALSSLTVYCSSGLLTPGDGNYGSSIGFTKLNSTARPGAAIVVKQTSADDDQCGLAFFTHDGSTTTSILSETFTLSHTGGVTISRTAVTSPAASDGNVFSGTYTPTLTNVTNVASSTANTTQYMRVGNVVTVSGRVDITATASATQTTIRMTLPVASALSSVQQLSGTGMAISATSVAPVRITADAGTDTASLVFVSFNTSSQIFAFQFTYLVI